MKHNSPSGRRNYGWPLKRILGMWDRNGSTSGSTPWQTCDDDDDDDDDDDEIKQKDRLRRITEIKQTKSTYRFLITMQGVDFLVTLSVGRSSMSRERNQSVSLSTYAEHWSVSCSSNNAFMNMRYGGRWLPTVHITMSPIVSINDTGGRATIHVHTTPNVFHNLLLF